MNKLLQKLTTNKMTLIASLPENSYELAKIAWESGVDAIKVHCNVFHNASHNDFGSFEDFKETFERIIKDSPVPVGIVAGGSSEAAEAIMADVIASGFDFVSLYAHHTPASFYQGKEINNFLSVNSTYSYDEIKYLLKNNFADILELSIIDKEEYGTRLNARDLSQYTAIASFSDTPCVVPSQKLIFPSDIKTLHKTGVKALMVGAVVLGKNPVKIKETLQAFRREIDSL